MPELPDLEYIVAGLKTELTGKAVTEVTVKNHIVIRQFIPGDISEVLCNRKCEDIFRKGPFIHFMFTDLSVVMHLMLAGRLQIVKAGEKPVRNLCFSLKFDDDTVLNYGDNKQMGKIYILHGNDLSKIPMYLQQGIDLLSKDFTFEYFKNNIKKSRAQVRVFIMDQAVISSIGNAYADEILFDAKIYPKTRCNELSDDAVRKLYESIGRVIAAGIKKINDAGKSIEIEIRDHMKVRNKKDQPCPVCGTTIRRANVLGYDSFFCPSCQPQTGKQFISWE